MARLEWDNVDSGLWFAGFTGRSISMSLCIEQEPDNTFSASYCQLDKSEYEKLDSFDNLRLAKRALEQYAVDIDCTTLRRR